MLIVRIKSQFSSKISLLYNFHSNDLFLNAQSSIVFLTERKKRKKSIAAQNQISSIIRSLGFPKALIALFVSL